MKNCGSSSVGRASASQAEGREFEPRLPLQSKTLKNGRDSTPPLFNVFFVSLCLPAGQMRHFTVLPGLILTEWRASPAGVSARMVTVAG